MDWRLVDLTRNADF